MGRFAVTAVAVAAVRLAHGREAAWIDPTGLEPFHDESQASIGRANLLAPYKPRVDVVVVGHAYAPPGADVDRLLLRVRLGDFAKAISVTGDRLWLRDGARWGSSPPRTFSRMLLVPERALRSAENPVGLDPAAIPIEGRLALPNFEPAAGSYSAVLGPVAATAPARRNLLAQGPAQWVAAHEMGQRAGPVPEGLNFAFFNMAPADQQLGDVPAGSALVLENLHPREPVFTSRLPIVTPSFVATDTATGRRLDLRGRCDTIWVDGDREIAMLVFRAMGEIERPDVPLHVHAELDRAPPPVPAPAPPGNMLVTQQGAVMAAPTGLPFAGRPPLSSSASGPASWPRQELGQAYADPPQSVRDDVTAPLRDSYPPPPPPRERAITAEILLQDDQAALPFQSDQGPADQWDTHVLGDTPGLQRQETMEVVRETLPPGPDTDASLPFPDRGADRGGLDPGAAAWAGGAAARSGVGVSPPQAPIPHPEPPPPRVEPRLAPKGSPGPLPDIGPTIPPAVPPKPAPAPPEPAAPRSSPKRPLAISIAALKPQGAALSSAPEEGGRLGGAPEDAPRTDSTPPPAAAPEPVEEAPPPPPLRDELTLEECAAVRAELSHKGADKTLVLDKHRLVDATWARIEREHLKAIDEGSRSGQTDILDRYDDAFVAAQDALRGRPVDEAVYARLQVARETGRLANELEELQIARADLLRLDRVWRRRQKSDPALAERLEDEMERLRKEG